MTARLLWVALLSAVAMAAMPPLATTLWSFNPGNDTIVRTITPVTFNGTTIFANAYTSDNAVGVVGAITCVDDATGAVLWSLPTGEATAVSLMVVGQRILATGSDDWIAALTPQGEQLWNLSAAEQGYTINQPLLVSTDGRTLYTTGAGLSSGGQTFAVLSTDLDTAPVNALVPIFTTAAFDYETAYLVPVNGSDFLFAMGWTEYYNLNLSDIGNGLNSVPKACDSCCLFGGFPPVVDPVAGLIYLASDGQTQGILAHNIGQGDDVAVYTELFNPSWLAMQGVVDGDGRLTLITVVASLNMGEIVPLQLVPYNGSAALSAITMPTMNGDWFWLAATAGLLFLSSPTCDLAAINLSTAEWVWTAASVFTPSSSSGSGGLPAIAATVSNATLYVTLRGDEAGTNGNDTLLAVDGATGAYQWQYVVPAPSYLQATLWVAGDSHTAVFLNRGGWLTGVGHK